MDKSKFKNIKRQRRKLRVRKKVTGSSSCPRLTVFRSLRHMYAQIIDDQAGCTLVSASTATVDVNGQYKGNVASATMVGEALARKAQEVGIRQVSFDRNGYRYHGRIKALADAARKAGLVF